MLRMLVGVCRRCHSRTLVSWLLRYEPSAAGSDLCRTPTRMAHYFIRKISSVLEALPEHSQGRFVTFSEFRTGFRHRTRLCGKPRS